MIKVIKILKYGCFALPLIFEINFFEFVMNFLTLGLASNEVIQGEYVLIFLGFSIMFYTLHTIDSMASKIHKEIYQEVVTYYMQERVLKRPEDEIEAELKKYIYNKYKPEKTKWLYKDVITNITDSLEKPFKVLEKNKQIVLPTKVVSDIKKIEGK